MIMQASEEQPVVMSGLILEKVTSLTADPATAPPPRVGAYVLIVGEHIRMWHTNKELLDKTRAEFEAKAGQSVQARPNEQRPANFNEFLAEALIIPYASD